MDFSKVVARTLLRETKRIQRSGRKLALQQPVDPSKWGRFALGMNTTPTFRDALAQHLPPFITDLPIAWPESNVVTGEELTRLVADVMRETSKRNNGNDSVDNGELCRSTNSKDDDFLDLAFPAIQFLNLQSHLHRTSSVTETRGVRIIATSLHLENHQAESGCVFAYRIRVENHGSSRVQLVGRHWNFTTRDAETIRVPKFAPGVVGQQPQLKPNAAFEYVSGVHLQQSPGAMWGSLLMRDCDTSNEFEAKVSTLALLSPMDQPMYSHPSVGECNAYEEA